MPATSLKLHVGCDITVRAATDCPIVAMLRPASGLAQWLSSETYAFDPWVPTTEYVDVYGNLCQRMVVPQGEMRLRVEATVETEPELAVAPGAAFTPVQDLPDSALQYLLPSRYCPSDTLESRAREIVGDASPGYGQVEAIRAWIHERIEYRYGASDASTDAAATLARGAGVCRDFAHVGIALTRAMRIPARMVVGYLLGLDPMDLHAWFEAYVGGRWYTFDATQGEPRGGRVVVAYGRDAADVAFISNYGAARDGGDEGLGRDRAAAPAAAARAAAARGAGVTRLAKRPKAPRERIQPSSSSTVAPARSACSRETSRCVTARIVRASKALTSTPRSRARCTSVAASIAPARRRKTTMLVCTVARSSSTARAGGERLGEAGARWRDRRRGARGGGRAVQRRGGEEAGLAHRAAEHAAVPRRRGDQVARAGEQRAAGRAEPLRERHRDQVERRRQLGLARRRSRRSRSTGARRRGRSRCRARARRRRRARPRPAGRRCRRCGCACSRSRPASSAGRPAGRAA